MSIYDIAKKVAPSLIDKFANHKSLVFERKTRVSDGGGGFETSWVAYLTVNSPILSLEASESMQYMQLVQTSTHKTYIKHSDGEIKADDRLLFDGDYYNITGAVNMAEADAVQIVFLKKGVST